MATTSSSKGYYTPDRVFKDIGVDESRNVLGCPKHLSPVSLSVCRQCSAHEGYISTGYTGKEKSRRFRVNCHWPEVPRRLHRIDGVTRVHCPKERFMLTPQSRCENCDLFAGLAKTGVGMTQRFRGIKPTYTVLCGHPIARRFKEMI